MHPTEALTTMSFGNFLRQTDAVGMFVFGLLVLMSVVSWYFIVIKAARVVRIRSRSHHVVSTFWKTPTDQAPASSRNSPNGSRSRRSRSTPSSPAAHHRLTEERLAGTLHRSEFLDRALRQVDHPRDGAPRNWPHVPCDRRYTAPFVGLFGTVWGIFHALVRIGASGEASIDQVAGPVGEALIMTALGLAVAMPAVLGYNLLVRNNRVIIASFDAFADDLHDFFTTGARVPSSMDHHRVDRLQQQAA